jgi:hypothetical protein
LERQGYTFFGYHSLLVHSLHSALTCCPHTINVLVAFDSRAPQTTHVHKPHITAPTPTVPSSHSALMDLLSNGLFPPAPTADSMVSFQCKDNRKKR